MVLSRLSIFVSVAASVLAMTLGPAIAGPSGLAVVDHILGPDGGWDYASFDPIRRRIYVSHATQVMVIDADTGAVTPTFASGAHLHEIVPVPESNLLVTTNGGDNSARILSAIDGGLIASIPTPPDPDAAIYDPASRLVLVIGGDSGVITLIDPKAGRAVGSISVGGALEFPAIDNHERLYVNRKDKNDIAVVDLAQRRVLTTWPMPGCRGPTGLALVQGGRLVSSCANGVAEIVDARTGRIIASLPIGAGPDAVISDPARQLAYIPSGRAGTLAVIALSGPADNTVIDTIQTAPGARTGAIDPRTGRLYLPTAEFLPPATPGTRPSPKAGTFQILVLDRK